MPKKTKDINPTHNVYFASIAEARHVFLDIVGYTFERSVEAQTEIIDVLNKIVEESVSDCEIDKGSVIYIPTGDGLCISLLNLNADFDKEIKLALKILEKLHDNNANVSDEQRKFDVRIAINGNHDNVVTDINGNRNIAGEGINLASRILGFADANQILLGDWNYKLYEKRELYFNAFRLLENCEIKHGYKINIHQYIDPKHAFLNTNLPAILISDSDSEIDQLASLYLEHCKDLQSEITEFILKYDSKEKYAESLRIAIYHASMDQMDKKNKNRTAIPRIRKNIFDQQALYYLIYRDVILDLDDFICKNKIASLEKSLESNFLILRSIKD